MTRPTGELLTQAFEGFERAASRLQERHGLLQQQVARLERELLDANRRLEAVLDALETGVAVISGEGEIARANKAFERTGLAEDGSRLQLSDLALPDSGGSGRGGTVRLRRSTEEGEIDLALTLTPVGDAEGSRVLMVQDITAIRREEEEGGRRRRLEALGRMAAELAHEVRNPLGSIRLFASLLRDDLRDQQQSGEMAEQILESASSLETTVSNLLAFASPSRATMRSLDLSALAADTCAMFAPTCTLRGVRLERPDNGHECRVVADPEGMRQVLLNLLGNALAATDSGGEIKVVATVQDDRAVLIVEDSGRGIPSEDLPRVFDPFFSRSEGGTGLGLSVVHGIVERHGGRLTLDSAVDHGTVARVELPVRQAEMAHE